MYFYISTTPSHAIPSGVNYFRKCPPKKKKKEGHNTIQLLLSYPIASSSANHETALVGLCVAQARLERKKQVRKGKNNDSAKDSKICMAARRSQSQIFTCVIHVSIDLNRQRRGGGGEQSLVQISLCPWTVDKYLTGSQ